MTDAAAERRSFAEQESLLERLDELETEVEFLRDTNALLQDHKEALKAELAALKGQPKDALHEELAMQVRELRAELAALKRQARALLEAIFNAEDPEDAEEIVADAFPAGGPAWVMEWYSTPWVMERHSEHPTEEEATRAEEGGE